MSNNLALLLATHLITYGITAQQHNSLETADFYTKFNQKVAAFLTNDPPGYAFSKAALETFSSIAQEADWKNFFPRKASIGQNVSPFIIINGCGTDSEISFVATPGDSNNPDIKKKSIPFFDRDGPDLLKGVMTNEIVYFASKKAYAVPHIHKITGQACITVYRYEPSINRMVRRHIIELPKNHEFIKIDCTGVIITREHIGQNNTTIPMYRSFMNTRFFSLLAPIQSLLSVAFKPESKPIQIVRIAFSPTLPMIAYHLNDVGVEHIAIAHRTRTDMPIIMLTLASKISELAWTDDGLGLVTDICTYPLIFAQAMLSEACTKTAKINGLPIPLWLCLEPLRIYCGSKRLSELDIID